MRARQCRTVHGVCVIFDSELDSQWASNQEKYGQVPSNSVKYGKNVANMRVILARGFGRNVPGNGCLPSNTQSVLQKDHVAI